MPTTESLEFASDATRAGIVGLALLLVALAAVLAERRRTRRARIDAVGFMPWTTIFFVTFFCGVLLVSLAVKGWTGR